MKLIPGLLAAAAVVGLSASASAERNVCPPVQSGSWLPIEQAVAKAEALGYAVKEAKRSLGCWEIEGFDSNGAEIEIYLDPSSGEPVKPRGWRAPARR